MLIRDADVKRIGRADVRLTGGRITAIGHLKPDEGEEVLDACGGALLPGLHDHHLHLSALAVSGESVRCGPPEVLDEAGLADALAQADDGWLRGTGYHESVAGLLDASRLDRLAPHRPVRIQHRSGRMWFLNSRALSHLLEAAPPPPGLEHDGLRWTGRLFDEDRWLRDTLRSRPPSFAKISRALARTGLTGVTDLSPSNDGTTAAHFAAEQRSGGLLQRCVLGGTLALADAAFDATLRLGPAKIHLHESALPDFDTTVGFIAASHAQRRAVAIHCVTEAELVFALAALDAAEPVSGDRIEHASVAHDAQVAEMARLGVQVVTQPHFIAERGDQYRRDVDMRDQPALYRLAGFRRAGIVLAGSSDAPFGRWDPWAAMRAAVTRRTESGESIGPDEALTPEQALALYLADPLDLTRERAVACDEPADLCLLDRPWAEARLRLDAADVRATLIGGSVVYDRVDQPPVEGRAHVDTAA